MITSLTYVQLLESQYLYPLVSSWQELFPEVFTTRSCESLRDVLSLAGVDQNTHILLSIEDETLVGSLCYKFGDDQALQSYKLAPNSIFLYNVFVVPEFQRQGKAQELLKKVEEYKKKLFLMVMAHNDKAIRLYLKLGYGVKQALENAFLMEKNLIQSI